MHRLMCALSLLTIALLVDQAGAQTATAIPLLPGTTRLTTGSIASVGPAGIPLGAIELAAPGISPGAFNDCSRASGSVGQMFDGGGMSPAPPTTCGMTGNALPTTPMTSMPPRITWRAGIPLGSVELGLAGLSPALAPTAPSMPFVSPTTPSSIGANCADMSNALAPGGC